MKILLPLLFLICMSCNNTEKKATLEKQIDSLKKELSNSYKPGLGEFMSSIQLHHAKLWFAGINGNWQLADFEIHEIQESIADIEKFCFDRQESKMVKMFLLPAIDSITHAFTENNIENFKTGFVFLTSSCNNCHKENSFDFNVVTIPTSLPVPNQDFKSLLMEKFDSTKRH
jgi:hypothetical protein